MKTIDVIVVSMVSGGFAAPSGVFKNISEMTKVYKDAEFGPGGQGDLCGSFVSNGRMYEYDTFELDL